jgi:acyl-CoA thioesterase I
VLLGGNDTLRRVPVEQTFADLAQIIERLQSVGAGVVLVGAPGGLYGTRYEKEYETLARRYGAAYVPNILQGLLRKSEYMADAIHPNNDGHRIMADRIEPALRDMLGGGR